MKQTEEMVVEFDDPIFNSEFAVDLFVCSVLQPDRESLYVCDTPEKTAIATPKLAFQQGAGIVH